jgi:hypothetical protein
MHPVRCGRCDSSGAADAAAHLQVLGLLCVERQYYRRFAGMQVQGPNSCSAACGSCRGFWGHFRCWNSLTTGTAPRPVNSCSFFATAYPWRPCPRWRYDSWPEPPPGPAAGCGREAVLRKLLASDLLRQDGQLPQRLELTGFLCQL